MFELLFFYKLKQKALLKPDDQLQLTEIVIKIFISLKN